MCFPIEEDLCGFCGTISGEKLESQGGDRWGGVWKRHADQMTTTGVGNGIEDEPVSMAVEPEWRLDRQGDSADQSYP